MPGKSENVHLTAPQARVLRAMLREHQINLEGFVESMTLADGSLGENQSAIEIEQLDDLKTDLKRVARFLKLLEVRRAHKA